MFENLKINYLVKIFYKNSVDAARYAKKCYAKINDFDNIFKSLMNFYKSSSNIKLVY